MKEQVKIRKCIEGMVNKNFTQEKRRRLHDRAMSLLVKYSGDDFDDLIDQYLTNEKYVEYGK